MLNNEKIRDNTDMSTLTLHNTYAVHCDVSKETPPGEATTDHWH